MQPVESFQYWPQSLFSQTPANDTSDYYLCLLNNGLIQSGWVEHPARLSGTPTIDTPDQLLHRADLQEWMPSNVPCARDPNYM